MPREDITLAYPPTLAAVLRWIMARSMELSEAVVVTQGAKLRALKRGADPTEVVIHESVTSSRESTVRVLKGRNLGVHFIVERDGTVTQHVQTKHSTVHAGGRHNKNSIAIEIVNPYYGSRAKAGMVVIDAVWAHKGRYILPTREQVETVWLLVERMTVEFDTIPLAFPCAGADEFKWGRAPHGEVAPGIKAHHRWAHADGLFAEHYCILRSRGYSAQEAFTLTIERAESGSRKTALPEVKECLA